MSAKNDITGDSISSKIMSKQGRDNWDNIFGPKKTAEQWIAIKYPGTKTEILNPHGWNQDDGVTFDTPISESDFNFRFNLSTVCHQIL
tara:strand:- start:1012 stop:1275 length:264 start_codon:yes stop_codon:yes gene_type:complete